MNAAAASSSGGAGVSTAGADDELWSLMKKTYLLLLPALRVLFVMSTKLSTGSVQVSRTTLQPQLRQAAEP
eukprot:7888440-Prorocentrum_lima.AAC.1